MPVDGYWSSRGTDIEFPVKQRADYTGYKELYKTSEGRKELKAKGYVVRSKTSVKGKGAEERRIVRRKSNSKFVTSEFIGWDGEGVNYRGRHHYVLLQCSTGDYYIDEQFSRPTGLSTDVCLSFLLKIAEEYPGRYHVIYGGSYDFNKILKDLVNSPARLRKLYETGRTFWKHYHIEWIRGKWLRVKNMATGQSVKVFDVISFFQMSFVKTLEKWQIEIPEMDEIVAMKERRGQFKWSEKEHQRIVDYCGLELWALVELMEQFRRYHIQADLPYMTGWYGPGAIANGLLRRYNIKKHMLATDQEVNQAALHAYGAGRIERLLYGNYEGPTTILDINSAYPYSISQLPNLSGGWRLIKGEEATRKWPMSLYHVRMFHHNDYASPLFFRRPNDTIFFPNPKGKDFIENWIWTPEYAQLVKWQIPHEVVECYRFQGDPHSRPFAWLEEMYYKRLEWKKAGNPAEKNLKLALNSIYGKMVQQAGYESYGKIPVFHQIEWGGYVTSSTRAQLYNACREMQFLNVVGVETDSIIIAGSNRPYSIRISDQLGEWGVSKYQGITYIQSGVYWLKQNGEWLDKYSKGRGYVPGTLKRDMVLEAWSNNPVGDMALFDKESGRAIGMCVYAQGNEFLTIGHCYRPGCNFDEWGNWHTGPKKLSLWKTTKREIVRDSDPRNGLLETTDHTQFSGWSKAYDIVWGNDAESSPT